MLDELRLSYLSFWAAWGIKSFGQSYDITRVMSLEAEKYYLNSTPCIFAIYHGQIVGLIRSMRRREKLTMLVSNHRDGEFIARAVKKSGWDLARGSQTYRAVEGSIQLVKAAQNKQSVMITVDGPRGPIFEAKIGCIRIAQITGLPIIPFVVSSRKPHYFKGWDRMQGGWWGSPQVFIYGDPIVVARTADNAERERLRQLLNDRLNMMRHSADDYWLPERAQIFKSVLAP
jgi:lysophospholipid acyltransferase (LPLAT)-like uncharacterized protein